MQLRITAAHGIGVPPSDIVILIFTSYHMYAGKTILSFAFGELTVCMGNKLDNYNNNVGIAECVIKPADRRL